MGSTSMIKTQVGVSDFAWKVIEEDERRFSSVDHDLSRNKLCSTIVTNAFKAGMFVTKADYYMNSLWNKYQTKAKKLKAPIHEAKEALEQAFEDLAYEEFRKLSPERSFASTKNKQFSLSAHASNRLHTSIDESKFKQLYKMGCNTDDSFSGRYVNLILETYAHLPYAERVKIFCHDTYTTLQTKIEQEGHVWIQHNINEEQYLFVPSKIMTDTMGVYLYVVGKVIIHKDSNNNIISNKSYECSFRLERITIIKDQSSQDQSLTDSEKSNLQSSAHEKKPAYMLSKKPIKASFHLTDTGIELLNSILINRPDGIYHDKDDQPNYYRCEATEIELFNYLQRLGPEIDDIQPKELRDRLVNHFTSCFEHYQQMSGKEE